MTVIPGLRKKILIQKDSHLDSEEPTAFLISQKQCNGGIFGEVMPCSISY
jgi:hypothetical protein